MTGSSNDGGKHATLERLWVVTPFRRAAAVSPTRSTYIPALFENLTGHCGIACPQPFEGPQTVGVRQVWGVDPGNQIKARSAGLALLLCQQRRAEHCDHARPVTVQLLTRIQPEEVDDDLSAQPVRACYLCRNGYRCLEGNERFGGFRLGTQRVTKVGPLGGQVRDG